MTEFKDKNGDMWVLDITFADVERVKKHVTGADGKPLELLEIAEQGDFSPISGSVRRVLDTVFWLLFPEIQTRFGSGTPQELADRFGALLNGDAIVAAIGAWEGAMVNFIPNLRLREALGKVMEKQEALRNSVCEVAETQCLKSISDGLDALSGNLPENSASTPTPTASGS